MAAEVIMPQLGTDMKEGIVLRWLKHEGDIVKRGDAIAEVDSDKATVEVEAFEPGVLRRILASEGQRVPVGQVIAIIAAPGEALPEAPAAPRAAPAAAAPAASTTAPAPAAPARERGAMRASPVARRMAEEHGIDLSTVAGTGPEGRITREDIERVLKEREAAELAPGALAAAAERPAPAEVVEMAPGAWAPGEEQPVVVEMSRMRQAIARHMSQSKREIPHFYVAAEVDMTEAQRLRGELNRLVGEEARISVNDMIIKAATLALAKMPRFNAYFLADKIQENRRINIAVAVALDEGLVTPALLDCDKKSLAQIARESRDLAQRARAGHLREAEYSSGTFTISNVGMYGVHTLIPIINAPQVAILGVGMVQSRPVVREGSIVVAEMMDMALSGDHRAVDGAEGAQFLGEVKGILERPVSLLL